MCVCVCVCVRAHAHAHVCFEVDGFSGLNEAKRNAISTLVKCNSWAVPMYHVVHDMLLVIST